MKQTVTVKSHLYFLLQLNGLSGSSGPLQLWISTSALLRRDFLFASDEKRDRNLHH